MQHIHLDHGIAENGPASRCNTVWGTWPWGPDIFPYMISHFHTPGAYDKAPTVVMHNLWLPWFVNFYFKLFTYSFILINLSYKFGLISYHHSTNFLSAWHARSFVLSKPPSVDKAWRPNGECRQSSHSTIIQNEFSCPRAPGSSQLNSLHRCWYRQAAKPNWASSRAASFMEPRHKIRSICWGSWQGSWLVVKVRWRLLRDLPLPPNLPTWHDIAVVYGA